MTQGYGMTELSPVSHCVPDGVDLDVATVGRLLPNMEAMIVDAATGAELPPGEPGELWCRGPNVMAGYLNDPDATAATLDRDGWLHTGDLVTVDADGVFTVVDRIKELIKYKGWSVAPAELEAVLLTPGHRIADARCRWAWSQNLDGNEIFEGWFVPRARAPAHRGGGAVVRRGAGGAVQEGAGRGVRRRDPEVGVGEDPAQGPPRSGSVHAGRPGSGSALSSLAHPAGGLRRCPYCAPPCSRS